MDKIEIEQFEQCTCYIWICPTCHHTNIEIEALEGLTAVFCMECGNTFEIIK